MGIESLPKFILALVLAIAFGVLGVWLIFFPENFRLWAIDHLDRNASTGEEMISLAPRTTIWDFSEAPNWYYRFLGFIPLLFALVLFTGVILTVISFIQTS
jgi:hypothetical protein